MTTYTELVDQIRDYTETDSNVLTTTIVNDFIENAENRIFREVDLDAFRSYQYASLTASNAFVSLPGTGIADFALIRSVQIYGQSLGNSRVKLEQKDISPRGHAIECRINAEDASKNFQPSPGVITMCHQPSGFRTRVDGAIYQGYKVTPFYDSMICKLICHGRNRQEAIQRMNRSLEEFVIEGIITTIPLHKKLLNHKKFIDSDFNVSWLDKEKII